MTGIDPDRWQHRARCGPWGDSGIPATVWTADRKPRNAVRLEMERVCRGCGARPNCAADALDSGAQSLMAAGVWIPLNTSQNQPIWDDAVKQLTVIAGAELSARRGAFTDAALDDLGSCGSDSEVAGEGTVVELDRRRPGGDRGRGRVDPWQRRRTVGQGRMSRKRRRSMCSASPVSATAEHRPAVRRRRFAHDELTAVDLFSGFGGLTTGIQQAGFSTIMAANHNRYELLTALSGARWGLRKVVL